MKLALLCSLLIVAPSLSWACGTKYEISSKLFINGKLVSQPVMLAEAGQAAEISQTTENSLDQVKLKVVANDVVNGKQSDQSVQMKFDISYLSESQKVEAKPQIVALLGEEASISSYDESNNTGYRLLVKVKRK